MCAPVNLPSVDSAGTATTIDNTNALHCVSCGDDAVALESGGSFICRFRVNAEVASCLVLTCWSRVRMWRISVFVTRIWPVL